MTIRAKLWAAFGCIFLVIASLLGFQLAGSIAEERYANLAEHSRHQLRVLLHIQIVSSRQFKNLFDIFMFDAEEEIAELLEARRQVSFAFGQLGVSVKESGAAKREMAERIRERQWYDQLCSLQREIDHGIDLVLAMRRAGNLDSGLDYFEQTLEKLNDHQFAPLINAWIADEQQEMVVSERLLLETTRRDNRIIMGIVLFGLLVVFSTLLIPRAIGRSLSVLLAGAARIGRGDFKARITLSGKDEFAQLAESFNRMAATLHDTVVSKQFLDKIIGSMVDTLIVVDPGGRIVTVNEATCSLLGYSAAEMVGQSVYMICGEEECHQGDEGIVLEDGDARNIERYYLAKDGRKIPMLFSRSVIHDSAGQVEGAVFVALDISIRKDAQRERDTLLEQLQQAQKMEAIGTLAGGIAHDFNNILMAILGFAELLHEDLPADSPLRQDVEQILSAGRRAKKLVKQILTFSRQGDSEERNPMEIQVILKEAIKLLRVSVPAGITIRQKIDADCGEVLMNPHHVHQVLMNLCSNAIHAMEEKGGELYVGLEEVTIGPDDVRKNPLLRAGEFVCLTVSDSGHGMDHTTLDRIFDPFFTTKGVGKGTGMGLSSVHGIVENYGGVITVKSQLGIGSTFQVFFPLIEAEARETAALVDDVPRGTEKILLVDDEKPLVDMVRQMLGRLGYDVKIAFSGAEALGYFKQQPDGFDLVISDENMPGMSGMDFAGQVNAIRDDIPIVIITGYSRGIELQDVRDIGVREFVMKPVVRAELAQVVRNVLDASS